MCDFKLLKLVYQHLFFKVDYKQFKLIDIDSSLTFKLILD